VEETRVPSSIGREKARVTWEKKRCKGHKQGANLGAKKREWNKHGAGALRLQEGAWTERELVPHYLDVDGSWGSLYQKVTLPRKGRWWTRIRRAKNLAKR